MSWPTVWPPHRVLLQQEEPQPRSAEIRGQKCRLVHLEPLHLLHDFNLNPLKQGVYVVPKELSVPLK